MEGPLTQAWQRLPTLLVAPSSGVWRKPSPVCARVLGLFLITGALPRFSFPVRSVTRTMRWRPSRELHWSCIFPHYRNLRTRFIVQNCQLRKRVTARRSFMVKQMKNVISAERHRTTVPPFSYSERRWAILDGRVGVA